MPVKKKKKGKKKGKKGKTPDIPEKKDPVAPEYIIPAPKPRERLIKLLTTHKVDEKELHGFKVSTKVLQQLTPQEARDLHLVFCVFDTHERGFIGATELRKAMKVLGFKLSREQSKQMVHDYSVKMKGMIDFNEFLDIIVARQGDSRDVYDEIMQGFEMFDYDNMGKLSIDNLKQACRETGVKFSKQELQDMMEEADFNGDGYVDREEFIKIMLQTNLF